MNKFNHFIAAVAGVLCFAIGASAESIGGQPGNEVGDFGEPPAGYPDGPEKKAASPSASSIDLAGGQRLKIEETEQKMRKEPLRSSDARLTASPSLGITNSSFLKVGASVSRFIPLCAPEPKKPNAFFSTAIHKQNTNDLTGAIADYQKAIKINENDPALHWYLGTAYEAAGKATEAKQEFEKEQALKKKSLIINGTIRYAGGYGGCKALIQAAP